MYVSTNPNGEYWGFGQYRQWQPPAQPIVQQQPIPQQSTGMFGDPFGTAMSGNMKGTLQPYVNRMTQNADNALNGGLLNFAPQSMVAGDAGGTPVNSTPPQGFSLESALLNNEFGKRQWMK